MCTVATSNNKKIINKENVFFKYFYECSARGRNLYSSSSSSSSSSSGNNKIMKKGNFL